MRLPFLLLFLVPTQLCRGTEPVVKPDQFLPGTIAGTQILRPHMPMPLFVGPGPPYPNPEIPNLETRSAASPPCLQKVVPVGVKLLSKDGPVTSSDPDSRSKLSMITDGGKSGDDGFFAELAPGKQWVQIDL